MLRVGSGPGLVILDGWGHAGHDSVADLMSPEKFDKWLHDYVTASGVKILADFRKHTYRGKARRRTKESFSK